MRIPIISTITKPGARGKEKKEKNFTNLMRFLYSSNRSKKKDPNYLSFKDFLSKVSKISRKRFLSLPYFLTRLRMRERQIEIKLSLSHKDGRHAVICPWKIEKRDSYGAPHNLLYQSPSIERRFLERFHGQCKCASVQGVYGQNTISTGYILTGQFKRAQRPLLLNRKTLNGLIAIMLRSLYHLRYFT